MRRDHHHHGRLRAGGHRVAADLLAQGQAVHRTVHAQFDVEEDEIEALLRHQQRRPAAAGGGGDVQAERLQALLQEQRGDGAVVDQQGMTLGGGPRLLASPGTSGFARHDRRHGARRDGRRYRRRYGRGRGWRAQRDRRLPCGERRPTGAMRDHGVELAHQVQRVDRPGHPGAGFVGRLGAYEHRVVHPLGDLHQLHRRRVVGVGHQAFGLFRVGDLHVVRHTPGAQPEAGRQRGALEVAEAQQGDPDERRHGLAISPQRAGSGSPAPARSCLPALQERRRRRWRCNPRRPRCRT